MCVCVCVCVSVLLYVGHFEIAQWLLSQKECSGNERDYFQSTPLHDAAESGSIRQATDLKHFVFFLPYIHQ